MKSWALILIIFLVSACGKEGAQSPTIDVSQAVSPEEPSAISSPAPTPVSSPVPNTSPSPSPSPSMAANSLTCSVSNLQQQQAECYGDNLSAETSFDILYMLRESTFQTMKCSLPGNCVVTSAFFYSGSTSGQICLEATVDNSHFTLNNGSIIDQQETFNVCGSEVYVGSFGQNLYGALTN